MSTNTEMITLVVNGKTEKINGPISLKSFLELKKINSNVVACELNLTIIRRAFLGDTFLKDGDQLEILQMIGGG